jgi:hypothetical protein
MTDAEWNSVVRAYRKKKGFSPLTSEEAEAAYDVAPSVPLPPGRIGEIVRAATSDGEGRRDTTAPEKNR